MIDHRLGGVRQEVGMVLGKPASAGFLLLVGNAPAIDGSFSSRAAWPCGSRYGAYAHP